MSRCDENDECFLRFVLKFFLLNFVFVGFGCMKLYYIVIIRFQPLCTRLYFMSLYIGAVNIFASGYEVCGPLSTQKES